LLTGQEIWKMNRGLGGSRRLISGAQLHNCFARSHLHHARRDVAPCGFRIQHASERHTKNQNWVLSWVLHTLDADQNRSPCHVSSYKRCDRTRNKISGRLLPETNLGSPWKRL
jgi:hypothetical protein